MRENHVEICRFGVNQLRNRWGEIRRVHTGPEQLFSSLISPEYTIREPRSFAPKSRASMKIRNQTYAPATRVKPLIHPLKKRSLGNRSLPVSETLP